MERLVLKSLFLQGQGFTNYDHQASNGNLVSSQSFPHLWKKLWKFIKNVAEPRFLPPKMNLWELACKLLHHKEVNTLVVGTGPEHDKWKTNGATRCW